MSPATPRQVLYALVAASLLGVVAVLVLGAAVAGLSPAWWVATMTAALAAAAGWGALNWRRTGTLLAMAIGLAAAWAVGTLLTRGA